MYQYHGLNALQAQHGSQGFQVLGVPCNQFYHQEPAWDGYDLMIGLEHVRPGSGFVPNFNLTEKIDVNGASEHPIYTYLKSLCPNVVSGYRTPILYSPIFAEDIRWNYEKFLIGPDGRPIYRYASSVEPATDDQLHADISNELSKLNSETNVPGLFG